MTPLPLKSKVLCSSDTLGINDPATQYNKPEDLNNKTLGTGTQTLDALLLPQSQLPVRYGFFCNLCIVRVKKMNGQNIKTNMCEHTKNSSMYLIN
jgi:hypothetical protein